MLYPHLQEKLDHAGYALKQANRENIVELCKQYLALLAEYRGKLYKLQGTSEIKLSAVSASLRKEVSETRQAVRTAIETTTRERNNTEMLLLSLSTISGYEAVKIFNRLKYEGHDDWELRASGVKFTDGTDTDLMTIQEAVETAGLLRRDEYIDQNAARAVDKA